MTRSISPGKVILFTTSTAVGGLVQVWLLCVVLMAQGKVHTPSVLLGDGGLFFFTTSLTAASALILFEQLPSKPTAWDLTFTLAIAGVCFAASAYYITVFTAHSDSLAPFHDHVRPQMSCAISAFAYAMFASARTGYFRG